MTKLADGRLPDFDYEKGTMVSLRDDEETHVLVEFEVSEFLSTFLCACCSHFATKQVVHFLKKMRANSSLVFTLTMRY